MTGTNRSDLVAMRGTGGENSGGTIRAHPRPSRGETAELPTIAHWKSGTGALPCP
jgi:hypothetical protein